MENLFFLRQLTRRQRKIFLACCAVGAGGYISYHIYTSPPVVEKRQQLSRFFHSLSSLLETAAQGSECAGNLWKDLRIFLLSDDDEVPQTLKQLFKIGQTLEFRTSMALLCASIAQGVVSGMSVHGSLLQDEEVKKALFEELSSPREGFRQTAEGRQDLGYGELRGGDRRSWKCSRWRSSEDVEISPYALDDENYYRRGNSKRSARGSRIDGHGETLSWGRADDAESYRAWRASRSYYSERGSSSAAPATEASRDEGRRRYGPKKSDWKESAHVEGVPEKLVGKIFSEAGRDFASAVVASAARSFVLSVLEGTQEMKKRDPNFTLLDIWSSLGWKEQGVGELHPSGEEASTQFGHSIFRADSSRNSFIQFLCSRKGKALIADCIETFIGTAVSVYLDKTRDLNVCDRLISTVSKLEHREPVKELLSSVCSRAVESLIRTSHEAISLGSSAGPRQDTRSTRGGVGNLGERSCFRCTVGQCSCCGRADKTELEEFGEFGRSGVEDYFSPGSPCRTPDNNETDTASASGAQGVRISFDQSPQSGRVLKINTENVEGIDFRASSSRQVTDEGIHFPEEPALVSQGWIDGVSRTLAVPSNRALVLDVAGTVTAEAVRSAIDVVASKVSLTFRGKSSGTRPEVEGKPSTSKVLKAINRTGEIAQATAAKAMIGMTMCIAICLHTLVGPSRVLQLT